jgi:hypothetical protein
MIGTTSIPRPFHRLLALGVMSALLVAGMAGEARAAVLAPAATSDAVIDGQVQAVGLGFTPVCDAPSFYTEFQIDFGAFADAVSFEQVTPTEAQSGFSIEVFPDDDVFGFEIYLVDSFSYCETYLIAGSGDNAASFDPGLPGFAALVALDDDGDQVCEIQVPIGILTAEIVDALPSGTATEYREVLYTRIGGTWTGQSFGQGVTDFDDAFDLAFAALYVEDGEPLTVDCVPVSRTSAPPVSTLALTCEPGSVPPGALVTCTVTGGDPSIDILWRASASPAFAGQGVTLDANGSGTFSFRVPTSMAPGTVLVELVEWDRAATVMVTGSVLPSRIPAGEGVPAGRVVLLGLGLLGVAALIGRRAVLAS